MRCTALASRHCLPPVTRQAACRSACASSRKLVQPIAQLAHEPSRRALLTAAGSAVAAAAGGASTRRAMAAATPTEGGPVAMDVVSPPAEAPTAPKPSAIPRAELAPGLEISRVVKARCKGAASLPNAHVSLVCPALLSRCRMQHMAEWRAEALPEGCSAALTGLPHRRGHCCRAAGSCRAATRATAPQTAPLGRPPSMTLQPLLLPASPPSIQVAGGCCTRSCAARVALSMCPAWPRVCRRLHPALWCIQR